MRPLLLLTALAGLLALPASALTLDPARSTLTPTAGAVETLSGSLVATLGATPPLVANTSFDLASLAVTSSGGLSITLDPALANPAAGVLSPSGSFLIPNLFLELDDGLASVALTVPNVMGSYGALAGCPTAVCLEASFQVDTGGGSGIVSVDLFAVPEPGTGTLLALGCGALALGRRRAARAGGPR